MHELKAYLTQQSLLCCRSPSLRFAHPWLAPMPIPSGPRSADDDGFARGDYSGGLFHHDVSESAIWLLRQEPALVDAVAGSLLCFLDCASPFGRVHRAELPSKSRESEPAKPVIAQLAARVVEVKGLEWAKENDVYPRVKKWIAYLSEHYIGLHGLGITHSSLASGFDSDLLSAGFPDKAIEGPDTSAFMILEYEAGAALAARFGENDIALQWRKAADKMRVLINALLYCEDDRGGYYSALRWQHGAASLEQERVSIKIERGTQPVETWASLLPLYAGVPDAARAERLIARLLNPDGYWGPSGVRTLPKDDPFFNQAPRIMHFDFKKNGRGPVSNWCGPVWVLSNYYMATALRRYGHADLARGLALATATLLQRDLEATGMLHECYNDAGTGLWPRTSTFISWNVLAVQMLDTLT